MNGWVGALLGAFVLNACEMAAQSPGSTSNAPAPGGVDLAGAATAGSPAATAKPVSEPRPAGFKPPRTPRWVRATLGDMPAAWQSRDGAQMVQLASGRILMIGGWSAYEPWGPTYVPGVGGGNRITNEVWKSDDLGASWDLLLPHDPTPPETGPGARFLPGHAVGVATYNGHAVLIGSDGSIEQDLLGDVWQESGNGTTWTRVSRNAPTYGRSLFMCGTLKNAIYIMGGQASPQDPTSAFNDVWRSTDGGVTWAKLADPPWSPRGMVYRPVEHEGKLVIVGGGLYADTPLAPIAYNGVYAFDGTTWQTVLPDGHTQFTASYYNPVASLGARLWLFNGYNPDLGEFSRAVYSDDDGASWTSFADGSGGPESHADATLSAGGRILRISGNLGERTVWEFAVIP